MIFVNTRHGARRLVEELRRHGHNARALTGNVVQTKRLRVLDDFRDGTLPILVATDVASRGLHIEGVSHVINYDLPQDCEDYVHRIGRTARVGSRRARPSASPARTTSTRSTRSTSTSDTRSQLSFAE